MSNTRKTLLGISILCYAVILYGFLTENLMLLMLFVMLNSIFLLLFARLSAKEFETLQEWQRIKRQKESALELSETQKAALQNRIEELQQEKQRYAKALSETTAAMEAAEEEKKAVQEQLLESARKETEIRQKQKEALENFLPPMKEGESENETIDIIQLAKDTVKELTPFAQKVRLGIQISTREEALLVRANTSRIKILFRNIIDNSIKYMNREGILVVTISKIGDDIFIVLKDNGNGLPEYETEHIFELNYQGSNRVSGNGLGLTQAKAIVNYYGGTIYAKSTLGNGMGIYVQLPVS